MVLVRFDFVMGISCVRQVTLWIYSLLLLFWVGPLCNALLAAVAVISMMRMKSSGPLLLTWLNDQHFADDIFRCIYVCVNFDILIKISPKFVPKGPTDNNPALIQIMAWCRIGDKPLSALMPTRFTGAYKRH